MALATRSLGATGMEISRVGFGAWAIGGGGWLLGWGAQDDAQSAAAIHAAVERGVNWIDTAPVYGLGHSEELIGRVLRDLPEADRPYVFTKCGLTWDAADRMAVPARVGGEASIGAECEASLRRLGVERLDLLQIHQPPDDTSAEAAWATVQALVAEGKVRAVGVCNFTSEQLDACEAVAHVDSIQSAFSLINRPNAAESIPWALAHDAAYLAYSPLYSGLLSGAMTKERLAGLPADDWRLGYPEFQEPLVDRNLALVDALRPIAARHGVDAGTIAICWTLAWPGVTAAIAGARSAAQVEGWIDAATLALDAEELAAIHRALVATRAGEGPRSPGEAAG